MQITKQTLQNAQGFGNIPSFTLNRETSPCSYIGSVILTFMGKMAYFLRLIWVCPLQEAENPVATLPTVWITSRYMIQSVKITQLFAKEEIA